MAEMKEYSFEDICAMVGPIAAEFGMLRVYLFDSRARGDNRPDSDYDFFVIPPEDCGIFTVAGFFGRLEEAFGSVDLVCDDPAERDDFTKGISRDMRLVYES